MIFVTVGTQLPFDRLVIAVDRWAAAAGRDDVIAQVGSSAYVPRAVIARDFLEPGEFEQMISGASLLVAHCGIGSMFAALEARKPIIMMPRRHDLGEHRNDHQLATAERLSHLPGVHIAMDEVELVAQLERKDLLAGATPIQAKAPKAFADRLAKALSDLAQGAVSTR